MRYCLTVLIMMLGLNAFGFEFRGKVVDSETNEGLPYALVFISDVVYSYTNEKGEFQFEVPESLRDAKARVSYTSRESVDVYTDSADGKQHIIALKPFYHNLNTVYIKPGSFKSKIFGKKNGKGMFLARLAYDDNEKRYNDTSGNYKGMLQSYFIMAMEVDTKKDTYLDAVGLYAENFPDFLDNSVIRVNVYDIGDCNRKKRRMNTDCAKEWLEKPITFKYSWTHVKNGRWQKEVEDRVLLPKHALVEFQLLLPADYVNRDDWFYKSGKKKGGMRWNRKLSDPDVWVKSDSKYEIPFYIRCSEAK